MLSCKEFVAELGRFLEGDLPAELRQELERHIEHCRTCQVVLDSTRQTIKIVTDSGELDLSQAFPESSIARIMQRIRSGQAEDS